MPTILTLPLDPDQAARLPRDSGRAAEALFYQWLALGDYSLSIRLHDAIKEEGQRPPFTVSPVLRESHGASLRIGVLDDSLWLALKRGVAKTDEGVVLLGCPLTMPEGGPRVEFSTYNDLFAHARSDTRIKLHFISPTSFRSRGMHYPLPDPVLVFQSWLTRWNEFAPEDYQINNALLDIVSAHVAVSRFDGYTEKVDLGIINKSRTEFSRRKRDKERRVFIVGFIGVVQYTVTKAYKIGDEWLHKLNALADYAPFCGTGHKTAQGMGQTLRY